LGFSVEVMESKSSRRSAVRSSAWLDVGRDFIVRYRYQQKNQEKLSRH
jgi:hypothetical protein